MSSVNSARSVLILGELATQLEIPTSLYKRAEDRYKALAEWLHGRGSAGMARCNVYPQGSFRLGTVVRPIDPGEEYDLDLVCAVDVDKNATSQKKLKTDVGDGVRAYAEAMSVRQPVEEKGRCWRLNYMDEVPFHMDILPATPDDGQFVSALVASGVPRELARHSIAITDRDDPGYATVGSEWPRSNPKGYGLWFESRMQGVAMARLTEIVKAAAYKTIDEVPAYEWKTPLQVAIQILKRHRDVMFSRNADLQPISMIITTLAAEAYTGEPDVLSALQRITARMPELIRKQEPMIPNPVNPAEDFADAWMDQPNLRTAFFDWHAQLVADLESVDSIGDFRALIEFGQSRFGLKLSPERSRELAGSRATGDRGSAPRSVVRISDDAPRPWGTE